MREGIFQICQSNCLRIHVSFQNEEEKEKKHTHKAVWNYEIMKLNEICVYCGAWYERELELNCESAFYRQWCGH